MAATAKKPAKSKAKSSKLQPLGERIVVQREQSQDQTAGGIILPESAKDKPARGTVVSVGEGRMTKDVALTLKPGDQVLFSSYGPDEITFGDDTLLLMREDDVLAVIE
jgi:chaperonin GroES